MSNIKVEKIGNYTIKIIVPAEGICLSHSQSNNIDAFDLSGNHLWNISKLLVAYSNENNMKYFDDMFFEVRVISENIIKCVGHINHCEIDLYNQKVIRTIPHW